MKKIEMTLAYFIKDDQILLPLKKKKIGKGKYNGVGGRLEENETHEEAMIRECVEEIGLRPCEYEYMAELSCNQTMEKEKVIAIVHVYVCKSWTGDLIETEEMAPKWFDINNIPYSNMMDDDKHWLPSVLNGKKIIATFILDSDFATLSYKIEVVKTLSKKA